MTIDMSQFYQVFFEETAEHLSAMETLLLGIDPSAPDPEQLNAIFRAAHSIKGSAGTFGFNDLAEVTHILENLLDRIRKGELAMRNDMIDAFLAAGDVLKVLLAAHRGEGVADDAAAKAVCDRLRRLTADPTVAPTGAAGYEIHFVMADGVSPQVSDNLLSELAGFGRLAEVVRPSLDQPQGPWRIRLETAAERDAIVECLEFVVRSDSLRVTPLGQGMPGNSSGDPDGAYGFFDDATEEVVSADDADGAYGFFSEPSPPAAASGSDDDPGGAYGLFEPVGAADANALPALKTTKEDDGYGFFEPLPELAAPPVAPSVVAPVNATVEPSARAVAPAPVAKVASDSSIRVSVEKVDQMINLVGELVITQAMLAQATEAVDPVAFERLVAGVAQLQRNTRDIQEAVMSIRMMPISVVFARFPRVVRDVSQKLGKQVELKTFGENTELDRGLIERIADPLTHLIRNSLDHGIEAPEVRASKGKSAVGTITLKASHQGGNIVIEVGDDGGGLNRARILAKARERGMPVSESMSDGEVWALIFEAGFSTADQITEVSGRGVGMDVVRRNIAAMGGRVDIESMAGVGTRMTVRLPLTLAILDAMSVGVGEETYLIPLAYVIESLQPTRAMIKSVSGVDRLLQVRGEYLPVVVLHEAFGIAGAVRDFDRGIMIVLAADDRKLALFVDAMIGQHQVVIKSLEANYRKVPGISGATIMGDGRVAMIIDVAALATLARAALQVAA